MSNRVYTYSEISKLKEASFFSEIAVLPQLTMSKEMELNMSKDMRVFKGNTMCFSKFAARLFPDWNSSAQRFAYITVLNRLIRGKINNCNNNAEKEWLYGCKKNLQYAVNNIIKFEEAGVRPEDINANGRDIELFIEMWKQLEKVDDSIYRFRDRSVELQNKIIFDKAVGEIFKFRGGKKQIVWHGFQFFTPIQQYIYDCFVKAGYDIFALIQCEERYPFANEIWGHLYNEKNGYPSKKDWIRQPDLKQKNPLGEIFENGKELSADNIKIIKYNNSVEFVEDVERIKREGFYIYCADDHASNNLLRNYYPEAYEVRNLLSYPIGQFVYTLHDMWDENEQSITLNFDGLRKCFASGWLSSNGENSIKLTEDLERILPYFDGCYRLDEWRERLKTFHSSFVNANKVFVENVESPFSSLSNPLSFFSPFSIDEQRIKAVLATIKQLIDMAEKLFSDNQPISIQKHMNRLDDLLSMNEELSPELYLEERDKIRQIFEVLESDRIKDFLCYPGDLAVALLSYMGGQLESDEENNKGLKTLVFNTFQIESAPISLAKGKVHICMADITRLPGNLKNYSWPIDETIVKNIINQKTGTYLQYWIDNTNLAALSNRYYIYSACKNYRVEISWIYQQGDKLFAPSPYVTLLNKLADVEIRPSWVHFIKREDVSNIEPKKRFETDYHIRDDKMLRPYDFELEYAYCPMRFVYSCIIGDSSAYRTDYTQYKAMVRLIQTIKQLLKDKYSIDYIADQVFEIFPYIRPAERRQMKDDAKKMDLVSTELTYSPYENNRYTDQRFNIMYLNSKSYMQARKNLSKIINQGDTGIYYNYNQGEGTRNCESCPHAGQCRYSWFGIDYVKYGAE